MYFMETLGHMNYWLNFNSSLYLLFVRIKEINDMQINDISN